MMSLEDPRRYQLAAKVKLRQGAQSGLWCSWILPAALVLSTFKYHDSVSVGYKLAAICSSISSIYLNIHLFNQKPIIGHLIVLVTSSVFCFMFNLTIFSAVRVTSIMILINMKSYTFLCTLLHKFPHSFSIGEAMLIIEAILSMISAAVSNSILKETLLSNMFSQVLLMGIGVFLLTCSFSQKLQQTVPFLLLFAVVMAVFTFPLMASVLDKNPVTWLLADLIFSSATRILLVVYWAICTIVALLIAWRFGKGAGIRLTILRKYFHVVVVAIFLPGVLLDPELLFIASTIALAAFLFLEAVRLYDIGGVGGLLNSSMAGFLDEKDQGSLILTHTYLLVGCSLPVWILPVTAAKSAQEILVLSSGIISLGVGDAAASVGGSFFGRTKWSGSEKSLEGTACSITAELLFIALLQKIGIFGPVILPWLKCIIAAVATSLVEAHTTQVDNLVLPLVMYIILLF